MRINIRGSKIEITDAIKNYIEEKIGRLERYFDAEYITAKVLSRRKGDSPEEKDRICEKRS